MQQLKWSNCCDVHFTEQTCLTSQNKAQGRGSSLGLVHVVGVGVGALCCAYAHMHVYTDDVHVAARSSRSTSS